MEDFEEMEMPTPCIHCGEIFDLTDGYESKKWHPDTTFCVDCYELEKGEIAMNEELEDLKNNLLDAEDDVKRYRKRLKELGVDLELSAVLPQENQSKTCLSDKAEKWDKLDEEISKFYSEDEQEQGTLLDIGLAAARAFGYL